MKKNILMLAGALTILAACDSSEYDLVNLVPNEYHKILYLNHSGEQELTLYNTGEAYTYQLSVIKAGSEPTLTATADLRILTQAEVDAQYSDVEAVNYQIIPQSAYTLSDMHLSFTSDDRYKLIDVTLNPTLIKQAIDEGETDAEWVLPFLLTSEADSVNANHNQIFLQITGVVTPSLGFASTDVVVGNYTYGSALTFAVPYALDTENSWDITADISLGNTDAIDNYNRRNGTNFQLLPADAYTLPSGIALNPGTTAAELEVAVDGSRLNPGEYMLPIRMSGASIFQIDESKAEYLLAVRLLGNAIDRSGWTGEANTQEPNGEGAGNGVIACAFDGNDGTYWHSVWQSGSHALPHILTFDTGAEHTFVQFALKPRPGQYCSDTGGGVFYVSSDNSNWTQVGTFVMNGSEELQYFTVTPTMGRYFRVEITIGNRGTNTNMAEVYAFEE